MTDMIRKLIPVEVKEVADRTLEIAGSTEDKDRMHDIIRSSGWKLKNFKKNPVFMWAHDYSEPPIGRATKVWVDKETKRLMFKMEFADAETYEFADTIYKLYKGGFLHATSVGFIPLDWEGKDEENPYPKWEGNVFTSQDLLELSAVPVPANPNALATARDQGLITVKEFDALTTATVVAPVGDTEDKLDETEEPLSALESDGESVNHMAEDIGQLAYEGAYVELIGIEEKDEELPEPKPISQAELGDELAFTLEAIKEVGLNEEQMPTALDLANEIITRAPGSDIPVDILSKVGTVLNDMNKERLSQIRQLAQDVFDSTDTTEESEKQETLPEPNTVEQSVSDMAEVANMVLAKLKGKRIPK